MVYKIFEGVFKDFSEEGGDLSFFDRPVYLDKMETNLKTELENPFPVYYYHFFVPIVIGLLGNLKKGKKLTILDYGGGVGRTYVELEKSLKDLSSIEYVIYDSLKSCQLGRKYLSGRGNLTFLSDLDSLDLSYDLMHLGSVLQYIEDLKSELSDLFKLNGGSKPKKLFFSDSYVGSKKSFVTRGDYYGHKHPWIIRSWSDLLNDLTYFGYKLEAKAAFIPQVTGKFGFYDMSNLPKELRLTNTWHLLFKLDD